MPFNSLAQYGVTFATLTPTQQTAINARGGPTVATVTLSQQVNAGGKLIGERRGVQLGAAARLRR